MSLNLGIPNSESQLSNEEFTDILQEVQWCIASEDLVDSEKCNAIAQLNDITSSLEHMTPEKRSVVIDFLCNDDHFKQIVGSDPASQYDNLVKFNEQITTSTEAAFLIPGAISYIVDVVLKNNSFAGMKRVFTHVTVDKVTRMDKKAINTPKYEDLDKALDNIKKAIAELERAIADPEKTSVESLISVVKTLGFEKVSPKDLFSWGGVFRSAFVGTIKSIGWGLVCGVCAALVAVGTVGILAIPAAILSQVLAGYLSARAYHKEYEKGRAASSTTTLADLGYTPQNIVALAKKWDGILLHESKQTQISAKQENGDTELARQVKGVANVILESLKATGKAIVHVIDTANR